MSTTKTPPKRPALGRGLASLIPAGTQAVGQPTKGLTELSVSEIRPNEYQPRQVFSDPLIQQLAASIAADGILQPVVVRKRKEGGYELIAGERRWRASQEAGLKKIPALIKEASDLDSLVWALEENIQRADLNPLEEALAYQQLIDEFALTQDQVAKRVGRDRSTVANMLRLLKLPEKVKSMLMGGVLSMGHARALLALADTELILHAAHEIESGGLSVRASEALVAQLLAGEKAQKKEATKDAPSKLDKDPDARRALEDLRKRYSTKVNFKGNHRKGRIEIEYYSDQELNRLLGMLLGR